MFDGWEAGCLILLIVFGIPAVLAWEQEKKEREFKQRYWSREVDRVLGRDDET